MVCGPPGDCQMQHTLVLCHAVVVFITPQGIAPTLHLDQVENHVLVFRSTKQLLVTFKIVLLVSKILYYLFYYFITYSLLFNCKLLKVKKPESTLYFLLCKILKSKTFSIQ
jgi:hypothetical protein